MVGYSLWLKSQLWTFLLIYTPHFLPLSHVCVASHFPFSLQPSYFRIEQQKREAQPPLLFFPPSFLTVLIQSDERLGFSLPPFWRRDFGWDSLDGAQYPCAYLITTSCLLLYHCFSSSLQGFLGCNQITGKRFHERMPSVGGHFWNGKHGHAEGLQERSRLENRMSSHTLRHFQRFRKIQINTQEWDRNTEATSAQGENLDEMTRQILA